MPEMENESPVRTKLPTELDEEQPFLSIAEVKLSLRQMLTMVTGAMAWFFALSITSSIFSISEPFSGLLWSWILVCGFFFALAKKDGLPYEEYLAQRIVFLISDRQFVLRDEEPTDISVEEADWDAIEDPYRMWGADDDK
jgi:hypothetical protein